MFIRHQMDFCGTINMHVLCNSLLCNLDRLRACIHSYNTLLRKLFLWRAVLRCGRNVTVHTYVDKQVVIVFHVFCSFAFDETEEEILPCTVRY